jgi:hypothetical protein
MWQLASHNIFVMLTYARTFKFRAITDMFKHHGHSVLVTRPPSNKLTLNSDLKITTLLGLYHN